MKKRAMSVLLAVLLIIQILSFSMHSLALEMPYQAHSVYEHSTYYEKLCAVELTGDARIDIINVAVSQLGYHEGDSTAELDGSNLNGSNNYTEYGYWFGTQVKGNSYGHFYDWCAMFVSWCARQAKIPVNVISNSAYANASSSTYCFNNLGYRARGEYIPVSGDLIFFDWDGLSDSWDHVGLVYSCDGNTVYTVEGNSSNAVAQRTYSVDDAVIRGYGIPNYDGTTVDGKKPHPKYNKLTPMKSYPCVAQNFEVKKEDYTSRAGEIYITDLCTINSVFDDGWCKVNFPLDSGGTITGYTPITNFIYDANYEIVSYVTDKKIDVYTKKDLQECNNWWTGTGDTVYIVSEYGDALQICYPIDEAYGGGYKLGWIPRSEILLEPEKPVEPDIVLESISVNAAPNKTTYFIREGLDITGLSLNLHYSDGTVKTVTDGFTVSDPDMESVGKKEITVYYGGYSVTFQITVVEKIKPPQIENAKITVANKTAVTGNRVEIAVGLENNPGIASMTLSIHYDTSVMKLVSVSDSGKLGEAVHSDNYASPYTLCWVNDTAKENFTENGTVATLSFEILEDAEEGSYPITVSYDYDNYDIYNVDAERVQFDTVNGSIAVSNVLIGDVNSDGTVNNLDRLVLTRYLANWVDYPESVINMAAADVNADGVVNNLDRLILTRHLANWKGYEELPCS